MKLRPPRLLVRHSILLLVALAMLALALIGLAGMSASVMVVESVQGSASAINVAGGLRRLTHRVANLVAVDMLRGGFSGERVTAAIDEFERNLDHPALQRVLQRDPGGLFAATYRGVDSTWRLNLKHRLQGAIGDGPPPPDRPRTAGSDEVDLHELLDVAEIPTPVVLVAHS